jgi:DNA polymerase-3 subunit delta
VIQGDDAYLRREASRAVVGTLLGDQADELAVRRFEGATARLADVLDELRTLPFFSKRRVVFVEDADPFVTANRRELEAYVDRPSSVGVLVLMVKSWPSNTNLARQVASKGLAVECVSPAEKELVPWLSGYATLHQAQLEPDAARLLVELVGAEVGLLAAEVEKLAVFVGTGGTIKATDVTRLVEAGRIETIWKIIDAATLGQTVPAITDLDNLLASGEPPIKVLAAITTSLLKVHHAGTLRAAKRRHDEACQIAGIPPFAVEKTRRQHAHLGPTRVAQLPAMLLKADLDLKGGTMLDPRVVLEDLFIRLSLPRTD